MFPATIIFDENASLQDLLLLVATLAVMVYVSFEVLKPVLTWIARGPLLGRMKKIAHLEFHRPSTHKELEEWGFECQSEEIYLEYFLLKEWAGGILMNLQHLVGGLCAVPAVFGMTYFSTSVRSSLACLGIMIEMGWEVQDFCKIIFHRLFGGEMGKKKYPISMIVILTMHHSLTTGMGLPMILRYRELHYLHRLCFNLQTITILGFCGEYCRALDVTKKNELQLFLLNSLIMLAAIVWTRFFDWFYIAYKLMATFYRDENWMYLVVGSPVLIAFSLFNVVFLLIPTWKRFGKFLEKYRKMNALPETADETTRKSAIEELRNAAADFASIEINPEEVIANLYETREIERRNSITVSELSRAAKLAAAADAASTHRFHNPRQSMVAFRELPSRVAKRAEKKTE